ncbi:helix-turn-helix domain-containing protein [Streptomyces sp. SID8111]|jgi:transcriptional regulator with XRE-family HTH domain|uniref:helix-turn-helix domain-containing protein n=1 Tax=unclassified Streptomyces TaxID=2593676 RepID=UPI0013C231A0|nr:helix-turn-helix transcriptional regulator [Streptomyces sp. SID8111]MBM7089075.1 helix-turn-helix domain-containing protein [Streptomyces sp. S12]NEC29716.1 helix-turn-helix domain-containing protein [Streptomyces sp. SID8111]
MAVGPTTRRRQLGADLRRLREQKRLTLEEAGARVGISKATLSRYETKEGAVKWPAVDALCREYGATDEERLALVELAKGARIQGWWRSLDDPIPESMNLMLTLEDEVVREDHYACMYIPGLLQTRAYAEAVHRASEVRCEEREVQHMVDIRMKRQELLDREDPPHIWAVIDEAALRRQVGGHLVMRQQLEHLLVLADRPRITVQVLPFACGAHAAAVGSFAVLRGQARELDVVYVDLLGGGLFMEKPKELERYKLAFEYLSAQALDFESSTELIERLCRET